MIYDINIFVKMNVIFGEILLFSGTIESQYTNIINCKYLNLIIM